MFCLQKTASDPSCLTENTDQKKTAVQYILITGTIQVVERYALIDRSCSCRNCPQAYRTVHERTIDCNSSRLAVLQKVPECFQLHSVDAAQTAGLFARSSFLTISAQWLQCRLSCKYHAIMLLTAPFPRRRITSPEAVAAENERHSDADTVIFRFGSMPCGIRFILRIMFRRGFHETIYSACSNCRA